MKNDFNLSGSMVEDWTEFAKVGLIRINSYGEILYINSFASKIINYENAEKAAPSAKIKLNELIPEFEAFFSILTNTVKLSDYEIQFPGSDGSELYIIIDAYAGDDDKLGKIFNIILKDITAFKKVQREFRETQNKLTSIINSIPDIIYTADPNGKITFISDSICQYGFLPSELLGKSIIDMIHPDDRDRARHRIMERRRGERRTSSFEIRMITRNSGAVMFEFKDKPLDHDQFFSISSEGLYIDSSLNQPQFIGTQGVARDITPRVYKDLELTECIEKYNAIVESLDDGYYETDINWNFININNSICNIFGLERSEIIGKNISDVIIPGDSAKFEDVKSGKVDIEFNSGLFEWTIVRNNGRKRYVEVSISSAKNMYGQKSGYRGIIRDVTEKHRIEEELLRARKLEAIGILSGGIAHDYNNALTAIIGNISLAKMSADKENVHLLEILKDAEEASFKAKVLTQRLAVFAKGGRPQKKTVAVERLIEDAVELFMQQFSGDVRIDIKGKLFEVCVDEIQTSQVLDNILKNASDAMNNKGMILVSAENITVEREQAHHELTLQPGDYVRIDITDSGEGIIAEDIYRVFDPYYTTKDMASGMGLATSYAIIKRHNGYIDVKSEFGKGSTFMIYIPAEN